MVGIGEVTATGDGDAHGAEVVGVTGAGLRSELVSCAGCGWLAGQMWRTKWLLVKGRTVARPTDSMPGV